MSADVGPAAARGAPRSSEGDDSSIYDLGYRPYEGERLGRRHAIFALYRESVRAAFGFGRGMASKVPPFALIGIALFPAVVQLILSALVPADLTLIEHSDYYQGVKFILALYVAAVAPDVVGRDQRNRSLTLYFSRAISREDYALAKLGAMTTAMLVITLVPQLLLFVGNALATQDFGGYAADEWNKIFPIVGTALFASWLIASIGCAIAALTPQRAFATVGIIVAFLLPLPIAAVLIEQFDVQWTSAAIFISPLDVVGGLTYWVFHAAPGDLVAVTGFATGWFALAGTVIALVASAVLVRRYQVVQP